MKLLPADDVRRESDELCSILRPISLNLCGGPIAFENILKHIAHHYPVATPLLKPFISFNREGVIY